MTTLTLEKFLDDVKHHEITVYQNNGVYRHLTFEKPGGCYHSFNITTFPHHLVITGNMGALIFFHSHYDLFDFFRNEDLKITPDDWAKQIESTSYEVKINSYSEFDIDKTKKLARKYLDDYLKNIALSHDEKSNLLAEFNRKILCAEDEWKIVDAIRSFELDNFDFEYFCWEDCRTHRYDYIWLCYAIVWGIKKFDELNQDGKNHDRT